MTTSAAAVAAASSGGSAAESVNAQPLVSDMHEVKNELNIWVNKGKQVIKSINICR